MKKRKSLEVTCQCGQSLARYQKGGKGRLVKMFLERITVDHIRAFLVQPPLPIGAEIICPNCTKRVASIQVISGKYAAKLNQGAIFQM